MRIVFMGVLLAALGAVPVSSATKYRPCTLLTTADLEGVLNAKLTKAQGENEVIDDEEPLKGEVVDTCSWILSSGSAALGVALRVSRAVASVPQMADYVFTPLEDSAKEDGETVEHVRVAGAECRIFGNIKNVGAIKNSTQLPHGGQRARPHH